MLYTKNTLVNYLLSCSKQDHILVKIPTEFITSSDSDICFEHRTWCDSSTISTAQSCCNMLFRKRLSIVYEVMTTFGHFTSLAGLF